MNERSRTLLASLALLTAGSTTDVLAQEPTPLYTVTVDPARAAGSDAFFLDDVDADGHVDFVVRHNRVTRVLSGADGSTLFDLQAGRSLIGIEGARAGDIDGDGVQDILARDGGTYPYTVRVFSGRTGQELHSLTNATDHYGRSVAGVGDVNGDGKDDFAIGVPAGPTPNAFVGRVEVRSGANGALLMTFLGSVTFEEFGSVVAGAGDIDGDGVPDVMASGLDTFDPMGNGVVRIFSGANGVEIVSYSGTGYLGASLAGLGDVDGDGRDDFAYGWPGRTNLEAGRVIVRSGATQAILHEIQGNPGDNLGSAVAPAGDFDGDGHPDFLVGAGGAPLYLSHDLDSYVQIRSGATGDVLAHVQGRSIGFEVSGGEDVDLDGVLDFIVTEWDASQVHRTHVYSGAVFLRNPYPGTNEDLELGTGINGGLDAYPIKFARGGDWLRVRLDTPNGTFASHHFVVAAQVVPTAGGVPTDPLLNEFHFDLSGATPLFIAFYSAATVFGQPGLPPGGFDLFLGYVPSGMSGTSLVLQGMSLGGAASLNGVYSMSEAHEIRLR